MLEKFARKYAIFYDIKIDSVTLETYSLKKLYGELETLRKEKEYIIKDKYTPIRKKKLNKRGDFDEISSRK